MEVVRWRWWHWQWRPITCTLAFAASLSESACDIMLAVAAAAAPPTVVARSTVLAPIVVARPSTSRAVPEEGEPSPPEAGRGTPTETTGGEPARAFGFAAAVEPRRGGCALDGVFFRRVRKSWACATFTASTRWRRRAMWRISVRWSVAMIEWVTVPHRSMYPRSSPMCAWFEHHAGSPSSITVRSAAVPLSSSRRIIADVRRTTSRPWKRPRVSCSSTSTSTTPYLGGCRGMASAAGAGRARGGRRVGG